MGMDRHEVMSGWVVKVLPSACVASDDPAPLREYLADGRVMVVRPSAFLPEHGDPEHDRERAAERVRVRRYAEHGDPFDTPERVRLIEAATAVEPDQLPGHGASYARRAQAAGFEVQAVRTLAIVGQGTEPVPTFSLRMWWPKGPSGRWPAIAALWINGASAGAQMTTNGSDRIAVKMTDIGSLVETIESATSKTK